MSEAAEIEAAGIEAAAARLAAAGDCAPRPARDPVNLPMIRNWIEAIGAAAPAADGVGEAPPAMIQVWTMPGLHGTRGGDDPLGVMSELLDDAGYTSVVATNCDQEYLRYLKVGEQLTVRSRLLTVIGPKRTALGEGWFVTTRSTWYSMDEPVATMDFRILKFKPPLPATPAPPPTTQPPSAATLRPVVSADTEFFWAGTARGELRIQRCAGCGALRHPPGPMCPACGTAPTGTAPTGAAPTGAAPTGTPATGDYVVAAGTGEVYSYVVHHHPPVPGKKLPIVIALVALPEGVRMVGELHGIPPDEVHIGLPVRAEFERVDDDLTLPSWRPAGNKALPPLTLDITPTFVISSALATRDFQDVHHDRDRAVARGGKDIFLNILTTTGLVQRYVTDWAGPRSTVRAISIRLGVPCYAGDTLTFTGWARDGGEIEVTGSCRLGDHVTATVRLERP
jgi:uncharacterized protein